MKQIKKIAIFDLDGTIICSRHRYRRLPESGKIDLTHWIKHDTAEFIKNDSLLPAAKLYKKYLADPAVYVAVATARVMKKADYAFIDKHLGQPDKLISRPAGSNEKGAVLKMRGLAYLRSLVQFRDLPGEFHEDNPDYLVALCRGFGYTGIFYPSEQGY